MPKLTKDSRPSGIQWRPEGLCGGPSHASQAKTRERVQGRRTHRGDQSRLLLPPVSLPCGAIWPADDALRNYPLSLSTKIPKFSCCIVCIRVAGVGKHRGGGARGRGDARVGGSSFCHDFELQNLGDVREHVLSQVIWGECANIGGAAPLFLGLITVWQLGA